MDPDIQGLPFLPPLANANLKKHVFAHRRKMAELTDTQERVYWMKKIIKKAYDELILKMTPKEIEKKFKK